MKRIKASEPDAQQVQWPRHEVKTVDCRKRDLVIRIADWTRDRDEPSYDVEVYIGGVYDWNESESCTVYQHKTKAAAKSAAIAFAQAKIAKLL